MTAKIKTVTWSGPVPFECDVCHDPIDDEFVDGKTRLGPWANMCPSCHGRHGVGVGLGRGQRYRQNPNREGVVFEKVEG